MGDPKKIEVFIFQATKRQPLAKKQKIAGFILRVFMLLLKE